MSNIDKEKFVNKSKKEHRCNDCGLIIPIGSSYYTHFMPRTSYLPKNETTWNSHIECNNIAKDIVGGNRLLNRFLTSLGERTEAQRLIIKTIYNLKSEPNIYSFEDNRYYHQKYIIAPDYQSAKEYIEFMHVTFRRQLMMVDRSQYKKVRFNGTFLIDYLDACMANDAHGPITLDEVFKLFNKQIEISF